MLHYPEEIRLKAKEYQQRPTAWIYGIEPTVRMPKDMHSPEDLVGCSAYLPSARPRRCTRAP